MKDHYYSKKEEKYFPKRLDVLLYAHDGRGLGHASRSIAIGMAVKRLHPDLRVLLVTGCNLSQALIGPAPLDWIKLPSYASRVHAGTSTGTDGPARFYKSVLGLHREALLAHIVDTFNPYCVLVDHAPAGKRKELARALKQSKTYDTRWILGLRAVVGSDKSIWSETARMLFQDHYDAMFWYGDQNVLGRAQIDGIARHFGQTPEETGYVSRLAELKHWIPREPQQLCGTIAIPWFSDVTWEFVSTIQNALTQLGDQHGRWRLFIAAEETHRVKELFRHLEFCSIEAVSERYVPALLNSRMGMIYAGYNSIMDAFAAQIPALVIIRDMRDREQQDHIGRLITACPSAFRVFNESDTDADALTDAIVQQLQSSPSPAVNINIQGAPAAARALAETVTQAKNNT